MTKLRAVRVQVRDVLGADELELEPGRVTILEGRNGTGKTSALKAIEGALGGGNLSRIARIPKHGEKPPEPEVVLVLEAEDGSESYRVERSAGGLMARAKVGSTPAFEDMKKPAEWLKGIYDRRSANPVDILMAKPEELATTILEAIVLDYDRDAMLKDAGLRGLEMPVPPGVLHPLQDIALVREEVFNRRTGVNRDQKTKESAALELLRNAPIPQAEPIDLEAARTKVAKLSGELADRRAKAEAQAAGKVRAATAKASTDQQAARAEAEAQIAAIRAGLALREAQIAAELSEAKSAASAERQESAKAESAAVEALSQAVADQRSAIALAEAQAKAAGLREQAKLFEAEAAELEGESRRLTVALGAIDAYRMGLAKGIPVAGLEVCGKEVTVGGIPFSQLNTQQRVKVAVQIACLRSKSQRLPLVFVDGAEALDAEHFFELVAELEASGVQAFVARVTESPRLTVAARGPAQGESAKPATPKPAKRRSFRNGIRP